MERRLTLAVITATVLAVGLLIAPVSAQSGLVANTTAEGDTTVAPGETFTVTYTLANDGDATANSAGLEPSLPDNISVASVSGDGTGDPARVFLSPVGPGESVTVTYTFEAASNISTGTSVAFDVSGFLESDGSSDTLTRTVDVQQTAPEPTLSVDAPTKAEIGGTTELTYTLSNTGDATADSAGINLTLPDGVSVASASGDGTTEPDRFFLDPIPAGDEVSVTYTLDIAAGTATGDTTIEAEGTMGGDNTTLSTQQSTTITLEEDVSIGDAIADSQGKISFQDTINVINAFNGGETVAGQQVEFRDVIGIIERFNSQ
jgi:uncharacterized repeat protein (TIGR01451 family)